MAPTPGHSESLAFAAMGTHAEVIVVMAPTHAASATVAARRARHRIDGLERRWSRFRPDSEVSRLTRCAGKAVHVSDETVELVRRAIEGYHLSGGSFDPTVLGDVVRAGYDRTFADIADSSDHPDLPPSWLAKGCAGIEIAGNRVRLPSGTGFDPGGIGKGLAADIVTAEIMAAGAAGACVNLGGDVRVRGAAPGGDAWTVAIDHPNHPAPLALVGLHDGAVATSTTLTRRWMCGGEPRHHLIDPGTGEPTTSDLTLASVVAGDAWMAEIMAKAVLLRGAAHPFDLIGGSGAEGLAVDRTGRVHASAGLGAFLGNATVPDRVSDTPVGATGSDRCADDDCDDRADDRLEVAR